MHPADTTHKQYNLTVQGIVQGVGFRPFVYRLAKALDIRGTVANSETGVHIRITAPQAACNEFTARLRTEAPAMAHIADINISMPSDFENFPDFTICESSQQGKATVPITPDIAICEDCRSEILNPNDRRYGYPFTNCTNCGPRFTIVEKVPYDRPFTSMRHFAMCPACAEEYHDPLNRRFHAQPNACHQCGPQLSWHDNRGREIDTDDCIRNAATALGQGRIVAIKGLGGFHLAADATSTEAVAELRLRKRRPDKPLAVMVPDLETALQLCHLSDEEQKALCSPQSPIVLARYKAQNILAPNLAYGLGIVGIMLPYTPLHVLLFATPQAPEALVMTSGNISGQPICIRNQDALARLHTMADYFLLHNRDIVTRVDDSVVRLIGGAIRTIRRARGFSPVAIPLAATTEDILACGAEMKNTFCIVRNGEAYLSQHIGELSTPECEDFYRESIDHLQKALQCFPQQVACDLHPDYLSTRYAASLNIPLQPVQHHHAHAAAVMAEHNLDAPCMALIFDGTGYAEDDTVYGGELYEVGRYHYRRLAHLSHLRLPGGDMAAKEPWRMAISLLYESCTPEQLEQALSQLPAMATIEESRRNLLLQMLEKQVNSPLSSSCGRLFDAVSGLLGICPVSTYEGQAAMLLEACASAHEPTHDPAPRYPVHLVEHGSLYTIDHRPLARELIRDILWAQPLEQIAYDFHQWLISSAVHLLIQYRKINNVNTVILCGGCMQNKLLFEGLEDRLQRANFTVYSGIQVPTNDGGISLGQAFIAGAPTEKGNGPPQPFTRNTLTM
ncbi:carbamoyltransferase HypF [Desulfogranum japonicum]|uniref:carbamoyltransferase HypF n=1 Tax=Desulfogranum japonicum TaxID=231447 RepID=UPI00068915C2|nr:carbamoyltransferase HypF [Desulfogranum japonicum]